MYLNKCGFQYLQIQCEVFQITVRDSRVLFGFEISSKLTCFSCGLHLCVCFGRFIFAIFIWLSDISLEAVLIGNVKGRGISV